MTQLKMDSNNDILIENNRFKLTEHNSDEEVAQRLIQNLRLFLGEWFLDVTQGVPYFQTVFKKGTPPDIVRASFVDVILATDGVVSLNRFDDLELDTATRKLSVNFDVTTVSGNNLTINEVLP